MELVLSGQKDCQTLEFASNWWKLLAVKPVKPVPENSWLMHLLSVGIEGYWLPFAWQYLPMKDYNSLLYYSLVGLVVVGQNYSPISNSDDFFNGDYTCWKTSLIGMRHVIRNICCIGMRSINIVTLLQGRTCICKVFNKCTNTTNSYCWAFHTTNYFTNEVSSSSLICRFLLEVENAWNSFSPLVNGVILFFVVNCWELSDIFLINFYPLQDLTNKCSPTSSI